MISVGGHAVVRSFFTPVQAEGLRAEIAPKTVAHTVRTPFSVPPPAENMSPWWALSFVGTP